MITYLQQHMADRDADAKQAAAVAATTDSVTKSVSKLDEQIRKDQQLRIDALQQALETQATNALAEAKAQFDATGRSVQGVLDVTRTAANLSSSNLAALTGEGSYPCVVPGVVRGGRTILQIWNRGVNPLTAVQVKIYHVNQNQLPADFFTRPMPDIGTLAGISSKMVPNGLELKPEDEYPAGTFQYNIEIDTQNGTYNEVLSYIRASNANGWTYAWSEGSTKFEPTKAGPYKEHIYSYARCHYPGPPIEPAGFEVVP